jgi:Uma2 family endonuclease
MGPAEFFDWIKDQDGRYELVGGEPVAMAGANQRHDRIVTNALIFLGNALRAKGGPCRPFSADTAVAIPAGNIRYPDLGIDCGAFDDRAMTATEPRLVVEVLSPTQSFSDYTKPEEYKTVPGIEYVLIVDFALPQVLVHARDEAGGGWRSVEVSGLEAVVELPRLGLALPLAELYRDLTFRPRPTLVGER